MVAMRMAAWLARESHHCPGEFGIPRSMEEKARQGIKRWSHIVGSKGNRGGHAALLLNTSLTYSSRGSLLQKYSKKMLCSSAQI